MGGEKTPQRLRQLALSGSPPRGRGKASTHSTIASCTGITPAWAGKSAQERRTHPHWQDHPRVGGEKGHALKRAVGAYGSPPRGRGKADQPARNRPAFRITPAWAGKSAARHRVRLFCRDHPRVGGEKAERSRRLQLLQGSPPRGRGKEPFPFLWPLPCRITPAWAGKSMSIVVVKEEQ